MRARTTLHQEHIYRMLEQTLVPPTTVTELDQDTILAATSRLSDIRGDASERYQLDSILTPALLKRLPSADEAQWIREYFMTTAAEGFDRVKAAKTRWARTWHVTDNLESVMSACWQDPVTVGALFGIDALVVIDGALWRQVAGRPGLIFEGLLTETAQERLANALPWDASPENLESVVFLVGAFARLSFVHGQRTSRAAHQAAGMAASGMIRASLSARRRAIVVDQFLDTPLNQELACDGVSRALCAIVRVAPQPTQNPAPTSPEGAHS